MEMEARKKKVAAAIEAGYETTREIGMATGMAPAKVLAAIGSLRAGGKVAMYRLSSGRIMYVPKGSPSLVEAAEEAAKVLAYFTEPGRAGVRETLENLKAAIEREKKG